MAELALTLKLPFYQLNQAKTIEFERLTAVNTQVANDLLTVDKKERKKLTSAAFKHIEIGSMWINQTIRTTMKQRKNTKSDAAENRESWAFYQLEVFTRY